MLTFIVVFIIVLIFGAILTASFCDSDKDDGFGYLLIVAFIVALFSSLPINIFEHSLKKIENVEKIKIYSMGENSTEVGETFSLGFGSFNSKPVYSYFIKNKDGSLEKKFINSNETKIYRGDYEPYLHIHTCKNRYEYSWWRGEYIEQKECKFNEKRTLYLPKNATEKIFSIR